ncbi:DUF3025 domain-containing protein [Rhodanobacter glycinis]|uniref:DUF3025 domain-containing protein n=1 Tax=Rhodanobacter glycinis TaxID=582702 RepID=A0A5B9E3F1_9GAMM|nr:DUF3025 domain-containing protein [Rhodanobacter glycinis]QEE25201.1 DUF3025 domain-containing protein [Rhodanobacter glycinis]
MRYVAPAREAVDPQVFGRMPLAAWREYAELTDGRDWPSIDALNAARPAGMRERFVTQTRDLLADSLHYEQRIAERGGIATRENNWHDLFNALAWLRHPALKRALNVRQVAEIAHMGPKQRSRAQYALTHFDEAGVVVTLRAPELLPLWDTHDWHGLFWRKRAAWLDGSIQVELFGHALLEHALTPGKLLVGKALVIAIPSSQRKLGSSVCDSAICCIESIDTCAQAIREGQTLCDPLELRPLPLAGVPGWHAGDVDEAFFHKTACFQPARAGRCYPAAMGISERAG